MHKLALAGTFALLLLTLAIVSNSCVYADSITQDSWITLSPSTDKIVSAVGNIIGAAALDDKIFLIGTKSCAVYTLSINSWAPIASPSTYTYGPVVACQNKIYLICNSTQVYNPATDTWETKTAIPQALNGQKACVVDDKIYVMSGKNPAPIGIVNPSDANYVYDPATDLWSSREPVPVPVAGPSVVAFNNKVYLVGGGVGTSLVENATNLVQIFTPQTNTWITGEQMPTGVIYSAAFSTLQFAPERIYVVGGSLMYDGGGLMGGDRSESTATNLTQKYDFMTGQWSFSKTAPLNTLYSASATVNEVLYLVQNDLKIVLYVPEGYQAELPAIPTATPGASDSFVIISLIYFLLIAATLAIIVIAILLKLFKKTGLEEDEQAG